MSQDTFLTTIAWVDIVSPPQGWLKPENTADLNARILSLWETAVCLIKNEKILCENQLEFLAMIHDHKVSTCKQIALPAN
jgi:hypothetical protein